MFISNKDKLSRGILFFCALSFIPQKRWLEWNYCNSTIYMSFVCRFLCPFCDCSHFLLSLPLQINHILSLVLFVLPKSLVHYLYSTLMVDFPILWETFSSNKNISATRFIHRNDLNRLKVYLIFCCNLRPVWSGLEFVIFKFKPSLVILFSSVLNKVLGPHIVLLRHFLYCVTLWLTKSWRLYGGPFPNLLRATMSRLSFRMTVSRDSFCSWTLACSMMGGT